jgi:hypothetical protein
MAEKVVRTFSLLVETDQKLEKLAGMTFRRGKGNVIDWAVDELWKREHPEAVSTETVIHNTPAIPES